MARLLIEDVTLTRGEELMLGVRLRGGATRQLTLVPERLVWQVYQTPSEVVAEIDRLLDDHTEAEVATILNQRGFRTGHDGTYHPRRVQAIRRDYALKTRYERLRSRGLLSIDEIAARLAVSTSTIKIWRKHGLLPAYPYNDRHCCLYEIPHNPPTKQQGRKLSERRRILDVALQRTSEVQSGA